MPVPSPSHFRVSAALALLLVAGCARDASRAAETADSAVPVVAVAPAPPRGPWSLDSALAAFRAGVPPVTRLEGGAPTRDSLVRAFTAALARRDTAALVALHLTRAEFAWLVYPESRYTRPPYRQLPEVNWMLTTQESNKGLTRLVERRAGQRFRSVAHTCGDTARAEGRTRYWSHCLVSYVDSGGTRREERLFGSVVERDGRFKIGSYANQY